MATTRKPARTEFVRSADASYADLDWLIYLRIQYHNGRLDAFFRLFVSIHQA